MTSPQKRQLAVAALLAAMSGWAGPALADPADERLGPLFERLADPESRDWQRTEAEINRIWSNSGSPAMDFLLRRGHAALEAEEAALAVEHFSALIDHAPGFAEGWNGRATAFFMSGEYALAIADIEQVLALEPRHFAALTLLALMLEEMGDPETALEALRAAQALHPHRENVNQAVGRLERSLGGAEL